jgi:uncharacterized protein (DUF302 family)
MSGSVNPRPVGARPTQGMVHKQSPLSLTETVDRLTQAIRAAGATLFAVIDHSGEAERVGLFLQGTELIIFGNPIGGTPVMVASPLAAIDLVGCQNPCRSRSSVVLMDQPSEPVPPFELMPQRLRH